MTRPTSKRLLERVGEALVVLAFCTAGLMNFGKSNEIYTKDFFGILLLCAVFIAYALATGIVLRLFFREPVLRLSSYAASLFLTLFLYIEIRAVFGIEPLAEPPGLIVVALVTFWMIVALLVGRLVVALMAHRPGRYALVAVSAVLLINPLIYTADYLSVSFERAERERKSDGLNLARLSGVPEDIIGAAPGEGRERPNIYFLSVDSYPDQTTLRNAFGFDNSAFLADMERQGFVFPAGTTSNFPGTIYSLNTTLNMSFHAMVDRPQAEAIEFYRNAQFAVASQPSVASVELKQRGYSFVFAENGYLGSATCTAHVDECVNEKVGSAELFSSIVQMTPGIDILPNIRAIFPRLSAQFALRRASDVRATALPVFESFTIDQIAELSLGAFREPYFFMAHVVAVHNYAWDRNCEFVEFTQPAPHYMTPARFADQLHCVNNQIRAGVDSIVARDPSAIIVLAADHGTTFGHGQHLRPPEEWIDNDEARAQLFRILLGFRFPEGCSGLPYDGVSLVNVMRLVISCIDGRSYQLLPDREFLFSVGGWRDHPYFFEVDVNG